jgi:hypothetical protein
MTSEYPDAVPIEQIVTMAEGIRQLPLAHLLPHSHQLQRLLAITEEINNAVNRASISLARRSVLNPRTSPPSSNSAPSPIVSDQCTAPTPHIKRSRKVSAARALQAACDIAPILAETIRKQTVTQLEKWCELPSDPRTCHLQPILSFQNDRGQSSVDSTDRIFLATSCQSLASDFAAFEQNHGRVSKHQVLLSQLLAGNSITVQRHGHHHGNFFSSLGDLGCHREKFDAGLLLGTKMRIIQSCAEAAGIGSTLGLLLGYECQSLGRLPYREFSELLGLLQGSRDALQPIIDFSNEFDEWWLRFSNHYHCMHGKIVSLMRAFFADSMLRLSDIQAAILCQNSAPIRTCL